MKQIKTGAVIVSAGLSSRMGSFKPLLEIGSITIIKRLITTLKQANVSPIVVVTGHQADLLERHLSKLGVICVRNEKYETSQMLDSAVIGLKYIKTACDQVLFTPVDIPLFTVKTVETIMQHGGILASPHFQGNEGHPLCISSKLIDVIADYKGANGLKGAIDACGVSKVLLEVEDEGILFDADTPSDYEKLLEYHNRQIFRANVDISLAREKVFFSEQTALLLRLIQKTGSVQSACQQMSLSYSKGWNLINEMEIQLGFSVVSRQSGGAYGGSSALTAYGEELLKRFSDFDDEVQKSVRNIFNAKFCDFFVE